MSNRNNVVFAVLPAGVSPDSENPIEVLPSGNAVEDLLVGQVGFFSKSKGCKWVQTRIRTFFNEYMFGNWCELTN